MDIVMYSTTYCGYCRAAKRLLDERHLPFTEVDCTHDPSTRARLVEETGRRTVPQIYLDGVPIGGFDELRALDRSGELALIVSGKQRPRSVAPGLGAPSMR
jgi:glutaredoxin 3